MKEILAWNGRISVWNRNGMEENCQYGIRKNHLPFHSVSCPGSKPDINLHVVKTIWLLWQLMPFGKQTYINE